MKGYFIRHNNENLGPYSLEELKALGVLRQDYVWKEGFANWQKAGNVEELSEIFADVTPPPFNKSQAAPPPFAQVQVEPTPVYFQQSSYYEPVSVTEKVGFRIGKYLGWGGILVVITAITSYFVYSSQNTGNSPSIVTRAKTPEELRAELLEQERQSPSQYLVDDVTMRGNLIGEKVLEGSITNNASIATYKDVVLEVEFYSKTKSVVSTQQFVVYEILAPKQRSRFKFKTFAPKATEGFGARIVNAVPVY